MIHQSLIYCDSAGYPLRAAKIKAVCGAAEVPFIHVSPDDLSIPGTTPLSIPENWIAAVNPDNPRDLPYRKWARGHLHAVLAAKHLPPSKFYWLIEGDVDAPSKTWDRLLAQTSDLTEDGLWPRLFLRSEEPERKGFGGAPEWCMAYGHNCLMRVSVEALDIWEDTAEETREIFTEVAAPSVLFRAGLPLGKINRPDQPSLYHTGTLRFNPGRSAVEPDRSDTLLRHPVKRDDHLT